MGIPIPTGTQTHRPAYTHAHSQARIHTDPKNRVPFPLQKDGPQTLSSQCIKLRTGRNISKAAQIGRLAAEATYQKLELTRDIRS